MDTPSSGHQPLDIVLSIWFTFTALCVAYVAYDQFKGGPEQKENSLAMKAMKWGWVLVTLYTGPLGFIVYWFLHQARARETREKSEPSLWEQSVESTIHCVAGDATGILIALVLMSWLRLPMGVELIAEYVAGFAVGLFLFQAVCMKSSFHGSYQRAVRGTFLPETLSMNAIMAGMIPVMIILMSLDMSAMKPTSVRFWGITSLAFIVSTVTTFPVNWWLVKRGLKHGMGGEGRASLRHSVSAASKLTAMFLTLVMLTVGIIFADHYGNFSMRADKSMNKRTMSSRASLESAKSTDGFIDTIKPRTAP